MFVLFIWRLSASKQIQYLLFFSIILYSAIAVCYVCETSVKHWLWINYLLLLRYFLQYVCSFSSEKWCFVLISVWSSFLFPYFVLCLFLSRGCIQQHSLNSSIIYFYILVSKKMNCKELCTHVTILNSVCCYEFRAFLLLVHSFII